MWVQVTDLKSFTRTASTVYWLAKSSAVIDLFYEKTFGFFVWHFSYFYVVAFDDYKDMISWTLDFLYFFSISTCLFFFRVVLYKQLTLVDSVCNTTRKSHFNNNSTKQVEVDMPVKQTKSNINHY